MNPVSLIVMGLHVVHQAGLCAPSDRTDVALESFITQVHGVNLLLHDTRLSRPTITSAKRTDKWLVIEMGS